MVAGYCVNVWYNENCMPKNYSLVYTKLLLLIGPLISALQLYLTSWIPIILEG